MVGLFPSNFVELLSEDYQPWARNGSGGSMSRQNSAQEQPKPVPQKQKSMFRKPFTAYAAAGAPNPAAAARERLRAGGINATNGTVKTKSPYSSMKRSSVESRESPPPAAPPARGPSNLRAVSPRPPIKRTPVARAVSPAPAPSRHGSHMSTHSSAPPAQYQHPHPHPHPQQHQYQHQHHRQQSRAISPVPPVQQQHYTRAVSPAPPPQPAYAPYRAPSPAPPPAQYQQHSRAVSPAPSFQYRAYDRGPSPAPSFRKPSPAPSFQYRAYDRGPSPSPYQDQLDHSRGPSPAPYQHQLDHSRGPSPAPYQHQLDHSRGPSPAPYQDEYGEPLDSPPPPPPPPHRVAYNPSRSPSPAPPPQHGYHTPEPPSPDPRSHGGHFTPSPLTTAMNDVMSSLQDMTTTQSPESPEQVPASATPWSPEAFDQVYQASAQKVRTQSALDQDDDDDDDGPPDVNNYMQRMESRLRRMQQQEKNRSNEMFMDDDQGPLVPLKTSGTAGHRPTSSMGTLEQEVERKGSRVLRNRKSAYDIGRNALGRTFTSKTNSTTTTQTSSSTNRSLMSGHSATNMSATSAGSYYRKKFGKDRPKSLMSIKDTAGKGYGFDDERPETPFTGVTYHSSHASSHSRPSSSDHQQAASNTPATDDPDPLGGLRRPKAKRSGFFRKMIDTAKTQAANARSTIDTISRPGSRAASRAAGRSSSRAASRMDATEQMGIEGGPTVPSTSSSRDTGLGTVDWVQVRRDINRSNSLSKNERAERAERCEMMDYPVLNPIDILYESAQGDEGLDGLPITEPTDFSACSLAHVDKSARFINSIPLGTNPATLAQSYICRPYRSDIQRLRAIFTWVSERISWEEDFEGKMDPRHVLQSKRGCSEEIAMVVAEMCASVGMHAEVVRGYLKTPGEPLDLESVARPNHYWNAVIVEGEWRVMDCSLAGPTHPKRVHYSTAGTSMAETWYFLARPLEICYSHVPLLPEQQHICPPQPHEVLMALPCATPTYFKHHLNVVNFDTSILNLDNLEMAHIYIDVPEDVECVAEVEARCYSQDMDGDVFESGDIIKKPALSQAEWFGGQKRYTVKALLPTDGGQGVLKIYAGPRGLMVSTFLTDLWSQSTNPLQHSNKLNPHNLAIGLPLTHSGTNPPYSFLTLHPTPHAQRHDLYVAQPQCASLALNNTFVFCVRQHPSSLTKSPEPSPALHGRSSPNPFARPASAMSMQSISATGSNYTNPSLASSGSGGSGSTKPAKLAIQTPSGKIIRLTRKNEHMGGLSDADGTAWETVIKIGEKGTWRGLVLADRSARWCVFAQWECT